ncbi:hypothetical protein BDF20DRAFT_998552 [Mycotypha africana]|uniref:uncharacterized protein n=1 Tax=Mycotypha africana TaxID=64632 RepID=UPI0023014A22|nr:uncharacterized protein BDF20DRAFT_998552 [Mycotypha africana]KAI8988024.1 hypothetical protein BDF20DRAFT_998552 [Mycotypha africana]
MNNTRYNASLAANNEFSTVSSPMFELVNVHGRLTLDEVYLNGLHSLRKLEIRNLSDQPILVKMRSNLRNQIAFQLENENILNFLNEKIPQQQTDTITTNTVSWSREAERYPFNQLFNYINHIDQIELDGGQSCNLILAFLPDQIHSSDDNNNSTNRGEVAALNEDDYDMSVVTDENTTFNMFNVTGSLFFFGYYKNSNSNEQSLSTSAGMANNSMDENSTKDFLSTSTLADYQLSVKFRASVCQSALWIDVAETGLSFDDCVIGETYYKEFTIQNRSEIDLYWTLNTKDLSYADWIQFIDVETENILDTFSPIESFSNKQIRIIFMPKEVGEFVYDLQFENANDSRNVVQVKMHATVRSVLRKETMIVSSGNVIDFGDCISGEWAVQQLVLSNISEAPVEVHFHPEGAEMVFDIKQDANVTENHENINYGEQLDPRVISGRRKASTHSNGARSGGYTTPATVHTAPSEMSVANSEFSSRSSSPTLLRPADISDGLSSPMSVDSSNPYALQFATIPEDSDSETGVGSVSLDNGSVLETLPLKNGTFSSGTLPTTAKNTVESYTRIEDLIIKPGTERIVQVSYRPQKDVSINDFNAGQLIRRNFRISLEYGTFRAEEPKEKKIIQCRARTCTSFVETIPKLINFGDTDVGTLKSLPINIFNRSDIVARVELQFTSKVLNCLRGEIAIQPRSYVELKLDLYPRKVNPDYRKQITLVNYLNRDNDQIIEVHSTNIDKNRVTFHSLFYRILTATGANFLDFGSITLNSPSLRTFTVENIRDKPLQLELTTSLPHDIAIYTRNKTMSSENPVGSASSSTVASSAILSAASTATSSTKTTTASKLSNSVTAEALEKGDKVADIPATTAITTSSISNSNRKRSKLLLDSINNRHAAKLQLDIPSSANEYNMNSSKRTADAKRDLLMARRFRNSVNQLKREQTCSTTAYLDLALPPLHSLKSYRRKLVEVSHTQLLKNQQKLPLTSEEKIARADTKDIYRKNDTLLRKSSYYQQAQGNEKENNQFMHRKIDGSSQIHLRRANSQETANHSDDIERSTKSANVPIKMNKESVDSHGEHSNYGLRNAKTKRSLGITAARYKSRKNLDWSDIAGKSRVPFEDLISVLEHGSKSSPPLFPKQAAEEQYVRYQLAWRRELDRLIEKKILVRTSVLNVAPKGEEEVVIVITPNGANKQHVQSAPKKQDARIFLKLLQFDQNIEQTEFENLLDLGREGIPVREIILRSQLCRSVMDLGQRNINFGLVERNERHTKTIVLHNRSETPLLYAIRKSGSIASGDIDLDIGRYGVVRSYGKREVEFVFEPTLSGPFMEKLVVENICDRTNDQVLLLKAQVRKPSTFLINSAEELNFGCCLIDQPGKKIESIVLTNTNKQSRMFEIRVDPNEVTFGQYYAEFDFGVKEEDLNTISQEAEEEIENLEQKLKIAKRKAQPDKVKKYLRKLAKLKNLDENELESAGDDGSSVLKEEASVNSDVNPEKTSTISKTSNDNSTSAAVSGASIKENSVIFKKTPESVVFSIDAHATKTISVIFKAMLRPIRENEMHSFTKVDEVLAVKGRILVHEYKNTDVCRSITYTAEIHPDETTMREGLQDEDKVEDNKALLYQTLATSTTNSVSDKDTNSIGADEMGHITVTDGDTAVDSSIEPIELERNFFDGERVGIHQEVVFYVKVKNVSDSPVTFDLFAEENASVFDFSNTESQELLPGEIRKVRYGLRPNQLGRQTYTFYVRNKHNGSLQPFTTQCLVHRHIYLDFPSIADEDNGVLDLGFSYVDPGSKYSQVTPLLVANISEQDILITCQSNLSHQVLIFKDEAGERGLVEMMPLKGGAMTTIWVAIQPNLLTGYLSNCTDECRELVGGLKFSIYEHDTSALRKEDEDILLMLTQTVKFTSIIGQSHLEVSERVINLGYTDVLNKDFYGAFTIKNKSGELPLDYEVECLSGNIELDRRGGTLPGWRGNKRRRDADLGYLSGDEHHARRDSLSALSTDGNEENTIIATRKNSYTAPSLATMCSSTQITFRIYAYRHGLLNEQLTVTNKRNSQEVFVIDVRLFVDCNKIDAWHLPSKMLLRSPVPSHRQHITDENDQTDHLEADPLPLVKWESIYICSTVDDTTDNKLEVMKLPDKEEARLYTREIDIANTSGQPMHLVAMSDVDMTASFVVDKNKLISTEVLYKNTTFLQRSGQLCLQPGQRVRMRIHNPSTNKLDEEARQLALQGKNGSLKGMLLLYDARQELEVLAIELEALFCMSHTELVTDQINLGKIGHSTSYKPARFEFQIHNMADVPATYEIHGPNFIQFTPLDRHGAAVKQKSFYIPSRKSQRVEGLLLPKEMPDKTSGIHHFDVQIVNLRNNSNSMHLQLKALMTVFELEFERLSDNGELILPTLYHPIALQNAPCDGWFVIHNKTDDDLRFEIGADIETELKPYIHLDVLSRYTNSPLNGDIAIGPQGSIEVRVRALPNEASRLPRNHPELTDTAGMVVAKLWVTTWPAGTVVEEDESEYKSRIREMIPIRCALREAATFSLSEYRLDFKLVTYYQENDNIDNGSNTNTSRIVQPQSACMPDSLPLTVINQAVKVPLRFKVTVEGPAEFPAHEIVLISGLDGDGTAVVEPGGTYTLSVGISNPQEIMPGQLKIHIDDLDAVGESRQTILMYVTEIVWDL